MLRGIQSQPRPQEANPQHGDEEPVKSRQGSLCPRLCAEPGLADFAFSLLHLPEASKGAKTSRSQATHRCPLTYNRPDFAQPLRSPSFTKKGPLRAASARQRNPPKPVEAINSQRRADRTLCNNSTLTLLQWASLFISRLTHTIRCPPTHTLP